MTDISHSSDGNKNPIPSSDGPEFNSDIRTIDNRNASAEKSQHDGMDSYSFRRNLKRVFIFFITVFLAVYLFTFFGRSLVDSILRRIDLSQAVHHDSSTIDSGVTQHIRPKITLIYRQKDGQLLRILADEEDISAFARENINLLEQARAKLNSSVGKRIHDATNPVFAKMRRQITEKLYKN